MSSNIELKNVTLSFHTPSVVTMGGGVDPPSKWQCVSTNGWIQSTHVLCVVKDFKVEIG